MRAVGTGRPQRPHSAGRRQDVRRRCHMSVLKSRPVLRWLVPVAAVVAVIGGGAALGTFAAAAPTRACRRAPPPSCWSTCRPPGWTGSPARSCSAPTSACRRWPAWSARRRPGRLLTGTHTLRVWYSGPGPAAGRPAGHARRAGRHPQRPRRVDLEQPGQHRHPPHAAAEASRGATGAGRVAGHPAGGRRRGPWPRSTRAPRSPPAGPPRSPAGTRTSWCSPRATTRSLVHQVRHRHRRAPSTCRCAFEVLRRRQPTSRPSSGLHPGRLRAGRTPSSSPSTRRPG